MEQTEEKTLVTTPSVVALTWVMKDLHGEILDELEDPVEFLVGGNDLLDSIQHALLDHKVGDTINLQLEPDDAFGNYDENQVFLEARKWFPAELEEGMVFEGHALPAGCSQTMPKDALYMVTDIYPEHVVLDGNHPLAGIGIALALRIHTVRTATADEIGRGSAGTGFFKITPDNLVAGNDTVH